MGQQNQSEAEIENYFMDKFNMCWAYFLDI